MYALLTNLKYQLFKDLLISVIGKKKKRSRHWTLIDDNDGKLKMMIIMTKVRR